MYRINWRAYETGNQGHGRPVFKTIEMAQYTARQMNDDYKCITFHWVEYVDTVADQSRILDFFSKVLRRGSRSS